MLLNYINSIGVLSQTSVDIINYLLGKGINVNHLDKNNKNALFTFVDALKVRNTHTLPIFKLLIGHDIDVNHVNLDENILFRVVSDSIRLNDTSLEIERLLLNSGVNVNFCNARKQNILF